MTNTLRVRRAERRLSQMALASLAKMHHNRYWRIENNHTEPTDNERTALATALGVAVEIVFPADVEVSA